MITYLRETQNFIKEEAILVKRVLATALSLMIAFSLIFIKPLVDVHASGLTRGEAAERIYQAARHYNSDLQRGNILQGFSDGRLYEENPVTYYELISLLYRSFGPLPQATGNNARIAVEADISDAPAWAAAAAANLNAAGVLHGPGDSLDILLARIHRVLAQRPQGDFYEYVNREWLNNATIPPGEVTNGAFQEASLVVQNQLEGIFDGLAVGTYEAGTKEQLVSDFYNNVLNMGARNNDGIAPVMPYLERIRAASSLDELIILDGELQSELGLRLFFSIQRGASLENSNIKASYFGTITPRLPRDLYTEDSPLYEPYLLKLTQLQVLSGVPENTAAANAQAIFNLEQDIAAVMMAPYELMDFTRSHQGFTQAELAEMFPNVDMAEVIRSSGIRVSAGERLIIPDPGATMQAATWFADEHLDLLKIAAEVGFLWAHTEMLSQDFLDVVDTFNRLAVGQEVPPTIRQRAVNMTLSALSDYVGQLYVEEFASESVKQDVEAMISEMTAVFRDRIQNLYWMSDTTKAQAINKLDAITYKVGWPDSWFDPLAGRELLSYADGGSLFQNMSAIRLAAVEGMIRAQDDPVDRDAWIAPPYTVNAFYMAQNNEIVIPYGILQPPFYDESASRSANLGAIGMVIGHELTHAFDTAGSQFDEHGNLANWWTEEDFAAFISRAGSFEVFFDSVEVAPGILNNGTLTLTENISDNGGLAVALEVAMQDPEFSAEDFFRAYAVMWRGLMPREILLINSQGGVHSGNRVRVNQALQNIDLFHETFNTQPGDGMYVPASERVSLW